MHELAATITGEASVCPFTTQVFMAHAILALGIHRFYGRAKPGPTQRAIVDNLHRIPSFNWSGPVKHIFSREDAEQARVRRLMEGRVVDERDCKGGLGLYVVY